MELHEIYQLIEDKLKEGLNASAIHLDLLMVTNLDSKTINNAINVVFNELNIPLKPRNLR